jgi:two-component sensor histidine kinase
MPTPETPKADPKRPVVEPAPTEQPPEVSPRTLHLRLRQQELLSQLGVVALQPTPFQELLDRAVQLAADGLEADFSKVLQYLPQDNRLLLRAGVGWDPALIGVATLGVDLASPSGYALRTGKPVISNHLEHEDRFETPVLLRSHGVRRAINVILQGDGAPFGVLEVDSRSEGEFSEHDIAFLQGAANILGMAIERQRYEYDLRKAIDHQKMLMVEINHRVKNSLQFVTSLLALQAATSQDPALVRNLHEASSRVSVVARIHDRLYRNPDISAVDLSAYLTDICNDLGELAGEVEIEFKPSGPIHIAPDRAVSVALLATELITNAARHAYAGGKGLIRVRLERVAGETAVLSVRDDGSGLPPGFDVKQSKGLGMKIVGSLVQQLGATFTIERRQPGSELIVEIPIAPRSDPAAA